MPSPHEIELRRLIAEGLTNINRHNGGRHMSAVARTVGVDRTTVTRWLHTRTTASVDHCRALAGAYPDFFAEERLVELHSQAALGATTAQELITIGGTVHDSTADVHGAAARSIQADPGDRQNRVCLLASLHLDNRGIDAVDDDPLLDDDSGRQIQEFRQAMSQRAAEGWKIRNVVVTTNPARVDSLAFMAANLDGPDVEIRAYAMSIPLALSPLVVANRDVFLAYDHRRWERPHAALLLRSSTIVRWATEYFEQLFLHAPYTLRNAHGPDESQFAALRDALERND